MSKKITNLDWLFIVSLVILVWGVDQITKLWAVNNITSLQFYGPFGLVLHRNPGAILGAFSDLPPILRVVSLSTGGAFLVFIYGAIQYLLPQRSFVLRLGMSILLGGILGNVTDRILAGSVVDFLILGSYKFSTPAFNFADAIQWVGYSMVVYSLIREGNQLWPNDNERTKVWVLPKFQMKYIFVLISIGLAFALISGVYAYTFISVTIEDIAPGNSDYLKTRFLIPFLETFSIISLGFIMLLFAIGKILSHRTAGPLYAFELFLEDVLNGIDRPLKLRSGDEFHHLEVLAESVRAKIRTKFPEEKPTTALPAE